MDCKMNNTTNENKTQLSLPLPPQMQDCEDMKVYARFMRYLRHVPNSRMEIKVLSSIQFTADILDYSDAHVAKLLVELGLRAPRVAFPAEFLVHADRALLRDDWAAGGPSIALNELRVYWKSIGEEGPNVFKRHCQALATEAVI